MQGFSSHGITPYAISIQVCKTWFFVYICGDKLIVYYNLPQNEPQNSNPTYPTALVTVAQEAQIGNALRTLLNNNGFSGVKIIGYEHNWDDAAAYPVQLVSDNSL